MFRPTHLALLVPGMVWVAPAQAQPQDLASELSTLEDAYEKANEDWYEKYKATPESDRRKVMDERGQIQNDYLAKFDAFAQKAHGKPQGAKALIWVVRLASQASGDDARTKCKAAIDSLMADYLTSEDIGELPMLLGYTEALDDEAVTAALRKLMSGSPHKPVQAAALHSLASRQMDRAKSDEEKAAARKLFDELKSKYGDLKMGRRGEMTYGTAADRVLFEMDHLQIGMAAPDFESIDETGARFKLSDYKGKVVVLDFWGYW